MEEITIYFDESGHTGPRLLDPQQRFFTYAGVAIPNEESFEILREARAEFPVQMPELKAGALLRSGQGELLVERVISRLRGRFKVVAYDKVLALAGKLFEYIYQPVLQHDPGILYQKGLHHFVANYGYLFFTLDDARGAEALRQFERYMRTLDPTEAPFLFDGPAVRAEEENDPFAMVPTFSRACRDAIVADNATAKERMADEGKWLLDLAVSSLWTLLSEWGEEGRPLRAVCDDSKPLRALSPAFVAEQLAFSQERARELMPDRFRNGFVLREPIEFGDSRAHPSLQIADIVAGAMNRVVTRVKTGPAEPDPVLDRIAAMLDPNLSVSSIFDDYDHIDVSQRRPAANWLMLKHLADKAVARADPRAGLEAMYAAAEASFDRGEFADL